MKMELKLGVVLKKRKSKIKFLINCLLKIKKLKNLIK